jgi:hypothetical protein
MCYAAILIAQTRNRVVLCSYKKKLPSIPKLNLLTVCQHETPSFQIFAVKVKKPSKGIQGKGVETSKLSMDTKYITVFKNFNRTNEQIYDFLEVLKY